MPALPRLSLLLAAAAAATAAAAEQPRPWALHMLPTSGGAACIDGSPAGFNFRPGVGAGARKLVVHLGGGGWCETPADCAARSHTPLGSSRRWPPSGTPPLGDGGAAGLLSADPAVNPATSEWAAAFVMYCSGDSFVGHAGPVDVVASDGRGRLGRQRPHRLYFRGRAILDAFVDALQRDIFPAGAPPTEIILGGCSAGGLGALLSADHFASRWDRAATRVTALPGAGIFLDVPGVDGVTRHYTPTYEWVAGYMNVTPRLAPACVGAYAGAPWKCFMAEYALPHVTTPLFISQSLVDSWQASHVMALPCNPGDGAGCNASMTSYLNGFRAAMLQRLQPVLREGSVHGAFLQVRGRMKGGGGGV